MTYTPISYLRLRELLDADAQLVEVLPEAEFAEEHLPEAINIPLKLLDAQSSGKTGSRPRGSRLLLGTVCET